MIEEIQSLQNPRVKNWRLLQKSRTKRLEEKQYITEGEHMVQEALKEHAALQVLISDSAWNKYAYLVQNENVQVFRVSDKVMESISDTKTPQGIAALCRLPEMNGTIGALSVALNGVQDPGNVGTLLRTMDAAGFDTLIIDEKTADPFSAKAMRASMGAVFRIRIHKAETLAGTLETLAQNGCAVIAGDLKGEDFFERAPFPEKVCIVIGNEGAGISEDVKKAATRRLKLPMVGGAESLNAAVAGSIMIYDVLREKSIGNH
ncbi:MAG: RNA methyltransferase [Clostridia bacterium]|nr:RNA methyltransferase [Clostridia bacterium]